MIAGESPGFTEVDHQRTASLLRATLESTNDGVLAVDTRGTIQIYNQHFVQMWQLPPHALVIGAERERLKLIADQLSDPESFHRRVREIYQHPDRESFDTIELKDGRIIERYSKPQVLDERVVGRVWSFHDVTERRRAEERLRESEERFRLIAENVGDLVAMLDPQGRRLYNSPSYRGMFGEEEIAIGSDSFLEIHPQDRQRIKDIFRHTVQSGRGQRTEFRFQLKDGSVRHIESEGRVINDAHGRVSKVVVVSRDISERKRAEQRQKMEHGVTRVLADSETLAEAMPRIIRTICETLDWDCGMRWAMDEEHEAIRCVETWNAPSPALQSFVEKIKATSLASGSPRLARRVWLAGEPQWVEDIARDDGFQGAPHAASAGLRGAFAFPVLAGSVTLGVLEFFSREIRQPDSSLLQIVRVIGSQIGQFMARKQAEENLLYVATHDALTGLPNRYMLNERFLHALTHAQRYGKSMALLFLDLDRFKYVNDTRGHPFGDNLLAELAKRLRRCLRDSDTVARFGGDEFVALIEDLNGPNDVANIAQKMLEVVRRPFEIGGDTCALTASIGVSLYPLDGRDLPTLLKNADIAIYRAKDRGRDNYVFHSQDMNAHLVSHIALEGSLRGALDRDEFVLHYQPKLDVRTRRITGVEALIRWQHPELDLIAPAEFIPLAEETGHIVPIGNWVLRKACTEATAFQLERNAPVPVSVNLSARQFEDPHLLRSIERALRESGLAPQLLELEITESTVMRDPHTPILNKLKTMGIRLALDDFGTGHSSLASVKQFPFDRIKIDRTFVRDIPQDADDTALTAAIIAMAHSLRLSVVAEGVETPDQLRFLAEHGCHEFQGFLFSKAEPAHRIVEILRENATDAVA